uniref:Pyruvate dehydrogenase E1 component subunit alpha n=1 Tax=Caldilinea aerophila TaxID=133453 RepID=A0A7C1JZ72_9CHLR
MTTGTVQTKARDKPALEREHALHLLQEMVRIRRLEEKSYELYTKGKIRGFMHLYDGEEAVAVGVMQALTPEDAVIATYREHGQALARGISAGAILAEMYGKQEGCARGRGGSMHLFDKATRFYGGNGIVGGHLPLAVGIALADKLRGLNRVTCCFFGDGAVAEGEFHESLNLAALWKLPVLFICENNYYCMGTALKLHQSEPDIAKKAASYRIDARAVDGMDVLAVEEAARAAVARIKAGEGPQFLECRTYRFRAHSMFDAELYRDKSEVLEWRKRDPILTFQAFLKGEGLLSDEDIEEIEAQVQAEIEEAVAFAEAGTWEPVEELERFVYAENIPPEELYCLPPPEPPAAETREITYREAVREAMRSAIQRDKRVFLMGADVGRYGGCFAVSKGLLQEFGEERIIDTPLSESAYTGAGIGAAMNGMLPIVEIMTCNFSLLALDQILNNAATILHMSGGLFHVPIVIRMGTGGGKRLAAQHSHTFDGWYAHIPGLKVLAPATVEDARGMLESALADPNPVLIFENTLLYNMKAELPINAGPTPIDKAAVRREGKDLTIIAYGMALIKSLEAAEKLAAEGIDCEVIDLRTLRPLDDETIMASVRKTHRALIVDEDWRSGSLAAEISARIMEQAFYDLDQPVERLCGAEVPMPYAPQLEDASIPQVETIVAAVKGMVNHG